MLACRDWTSQPSHRKHASVPWAQALSYNACSPPGWSVSGVTSNQHAHTVHACIMHGQQTHVLHTAHAAVSAGLLCVAGVYEGQHVTMYQISHDLHKGDILSPRVPLFSIIPAFQNCICCCPIDRMRLPTASMTKSAKMHVRMPECNHIRVCVCVCVCA